MSRPSTSTSYSGRLVDLCLFPKLATPDTAAGMSVGPSTRVIAGPAKACQKFMVVFLTEKGSDRVRPDMGTSFPTILRNGSVFVTPGQIEQLFNVEALVAINYLNSIRSKGQPKDEIVTKVTLRTYMATRTSLAITADVYFADGSISPIILPAIWQP